MNKRGNMQTSSAAVALPTPEAKITARKLVQAEVELDLRRAVMKEIDKKKLTIRQVVEWGLKAYLLQANPAKAAELGITTNDTAGI